MKHILNVWKDLYWYSFRTPSKNAYGYWILRTVSEKCVHIFSDLLRYSHAALIGAETFLVLAYNLITNRFIKNTFSISCDWLKIDIY